MKNSIYIIVCTILLFHGLISGQNVKCEVTIYLSPGGNFIGTYFPINSSGNDTVKKVISEEEYYMCYMQDCRGAMKFEAYSRGVRVIEGNYVNSLDTLKHCVIVDDGHSPDQSQVVKVETYFQPLKDGVWKYYNEQGKLIKEEAWSKGILLGRKDY